MSAKLVLDNGAYLAKSALSTDTHVRCTPNFLSKSRSARETYVGSELDDCKDYSGLFYNLAFHKGIQTNWDIGRQVWSQIFKKHNIDIASTHLIVTEPIFNFGFSRECLEELVFEEFGFEALIRTNPPTLASYKWLKESGQEFCLIVDSGYSFTHIVPFYRGKILLEGLRRINVGGKHLTNLLKEVISYRQLMVMDETYVINQVKEEMCFVSTDFEADMKVAKLKAGENTIARDYVLPDYANIRKGYAKSLEESTGKPTNNEQIIRLNNERFTIPELLFHPSDIGIKEMGICEAIVDSVESCQPDVRPHLYKNIFLIGGNVLLSGFRERVYNDVRTLVSDEYELGVRTSGQDGLIYACQGGQLLANTQSDCDDLLVTKKQYDEMGHSICKKKFDI